MKDIKSVMIGFLLATSCFLFMGQSDGPTKYSTDNGRYQISSVYDSDALSRIILSTVIDTRTGKVVSKIKSKAKQYK